LREAKRDHQKIIKEAKEAKEKLVILGAEAELRARHALQTPFSDPIRAASAIPTRLLSTDLEVGS